MTYILIACLTKCLIVNPVPQPLSSCEREARLGRVTLTDDDGSTISAVGYRFACRPLS